jgi:hypothetical protein
MYLGQISTKLNYRCSFLHPFFQFVQMKIIDEKKELKRRWYRRKLNA